MHFLLASQCNLILLAAEASASTGNATKGIGDIAKIISDYGIMVVICAVVVIFMYRYMNNIMKRDNALFENMSPKLDKITTDLLNLQSQLSSLITSHNAHTSQSLRALEKDEAEIRNRLLEINDSVKEISGQITALQRNYDTIFQIITSYAYGGGGRVGIPYREIHRETYTANAYSEEFAEDDGQDISIVESSNDDKK